MLTDYTVKIMNNNDIKAKFSRQINKTLNNFVWIFFHFCIFFIFQVELAVHLNHTPRNHHHHQTPDHLSLNFLSCGFLARLPFFSLGLRCSFMDKEYSSTAPISCSMGCTLLDIVYVCW